MNTLIVFTTGFATALLYAKGKADPMKSAMIDIQTGQPVGAEENPKRFGRKIPVMRSPASIRLKLEAEAQYDGHICGACAMYALTRWHGLIN